MLKFGKKTKMEKYHLTCKILYKDGLLGVGEINIIEEFSNMK